LKRTTIYLEPELEIRLQLQARLRRTPMSEIIREALRQYLEKRPRSLPPGAGEFDSGLADTAERTDAVLAETGFGESKE
jgi:predicted transcriptional regulator